LSSKEPLSTATHKLFFLFDYVEDTFPIYVSLSGETYGLFGTTSRAFTRIHFTVETEVKGHFPYPDTEVQRKPIAARIGQSRCRSVTSRTF
jgi:hypothetical protein